MINDGLKIEEVLRALDQSCPICKATSVYMTWPIDDIRNICTKHLWYSRNNSLVIDCRIACEQELKRRGRIP